MKVVGLTGGIATGKSTVARLLAGWGVPVIDADRVAREVVEPGEPALVRIASVFGPDVIAPDGRLDRAAMRRLIARDPAARKALEAITHPAILERIARELTTLAEAGHEVAVVEAALMVETGSYRMYAALLVVSCSPELQLARVMARDGVPLDEAKAIVATQLPLADKEKVATVVIRNDGGLAELETATRAAAATLGLISRP